MLVAVIKIEQRKAKKKEGFPHVTAQNHVNVSIKYSVWEISNGDFLWS